MRIHAMASSNRRVTASSIETVGAWEARRRSAPKSVIANLSRIPGVGPSIAADLCLLGVREAAELRGRDPESLYAELSRQVGRQVDRCVLYVFRCAVYFASEAKPDPELLKWWNWKDCNG
jgi:hypothetical protein